MLSSSSSLSLSSRILLRQCRLSTAAAKRVSPLSSTQRLSAAVPTLQVRGMATAGGGGGGVPVPRSQNAKLFAGHATNEGWETTVYFYYGLSTLLIIGVLGFAPDTEITTWAKQEAAARLHLKETGVVKEFEFGKHYLDMMEDETKSNWDKFSTKAMLFMKDDDDEGEDEEEEEDGEAGEGENEEEGGGGDDDDDDDE